MKHHSTRAAALLALCLAGASALAKGSAIQTLPKGQLYEQRDVNRSKAQCRARVLARGSFEGVYEGEECGEGCSAVFRLDSGEKAYLGLSCNADKLYGPEGRRSLVHFEVRRERYEYKDHARLEPRAGRVCGRRWHDGRGLALRPGGVSQLRAKTLAKH